MSNQQPGHLETVPPFTVPCEGCEARFLHCPHRESNPGSLLGSPLHNRCATPVPLTNYENFEMINSNTKLKFQTI